MLFIAHRSGRRLQSSPSSATRGQLRLIEQKRRSKGVKRLDRGWLQFCTGFGCNRCGNSDGCCSLSCCHETGDVAFMSNNPRKLAGAGHLGQASLRKMQQSIFLMLIAKVATIVLAAVRYASLWAAALADVGTSCLGAGALDPVKRRLRL